jgi:DNA mismatch repair protein MutL
LVTIFALSFPEVSFNLKIDNRELIKVKSPETLPQRINSLLGVDAFKSLIQIPPEDSLIKITGYVARPELSKSSRTDIRFFVNKRSISNRSLLHALTSAYGDMLTKGRFPLAIIFLEVPADLVDVNVHPQKLEVKFQDERGAHDLLYRAVKKALDREFTTVVRQTMSATPSYEIPYPSGLPLKEKTAQYHTSFEVNPSALTEILAASKSVSEQSRDEPTAQANFYQIFNTYIVTQAHDQLLIVDQHAAHERVLYEQILGSLQIDTLSSSQKLLFPETAELDPTQLSLLQFNLKPLEKLGFEIQPLGGRTVLISALPAIAKHGSVQFLKEVLQEFEEQQKRGKDQRTALASALACKAAVKAGDSLSIPEMQSLLKNLLSLDTPQVCPHGRPTLIRIPIAELERRFGRS